MYIHGFAVYLRDVQHRKILGGKVMAVEEMNDNWGG
jgi:hypothetical protein